MLKLEKPFFMSDPSWFEYDKDTYTYVLTPQAPEEAKKSFNDFYKNINGFGELEGKIQKKMF